MTILGRVSRSLGAIARDLGALRTTLSGGQLSPVVPRPPRPATHAPIALGTRELRVVSKVQETATAVTVTVEDVTGAAIPFRAGQFFTLLVLIDGALQKRAYSASNAPTADGRVSFTVKEAPGGRVSSHIVRHARVGESWKALGPSGSFVAPSPQTGGLRLVLLAGGSGITPIMSIIRSVLPNDREAELSLVYGNETADSIIFEQELAKLVAEFGSRLVVRHVLRSPPPGWAGGVGQLDVAVMTAELDRLGVAAAEDYFVCGPGPMLEAADRVLSARGASPARVHVERFTSPARAEDQAKQPMTGGEVRILAKNRAERVVICRPGETILDAALAAGEALPYSCSLGGCGACAVTLTSGDVRMDEPNCLRSDEREARRVLTCIGRPCGSVTVEVP